MTAAIAWKLVAMFVSVALGWVASRRRWLGRAQDGDPARVLGNVAFAIFVPALLFRTTARLDLAHMPWRTLAAFFVPVLLVMGAVYLWHRRAGSIGGPAAPAVHAVTAVFGNSVQVGLPFAAALFGETGLGLHIALVSLHALVLLSMLTALAELDLARAGAGEHVGAALRQTLLLTARNTVVHPVVLPVLVGLAWNLTGLPLHPALDEGLALLGSAVVPVCLVLIGLTLAEYGLHGHLRGALGASLLKLVVLPAVVLAVAHWGFGLQGQPLAVVVMMSSLPTGSNALIFAQRYETLQGRTTAAIVVSTVAFLVTGSFWLAVLRLLSPWPAP